MEGQSSTKQLNSVYFQSDVTTFHVFKTRWRRHKDLKVCQTFKNFHLINIKDSGLEEWWGSWQKRHKN